MKIFHRKNKRGSQSCCTAVIVAAGTSSRMGQDKMLMELGGDPVIVHTLRAFEAAPSVANVVIVAGENSLPEIAALCREYALNKVCKVVRGGNTRLQSALIGALEADGDLPLIAIHDGARPFVDVSVIERVVAKAAETGAAAPAVPVKDTVKVARDGIVEQTLDRTSLFAIQTPQIFDAALIRAALQKAAEDGAEITDDCTAVERLGMKVTLVPGDEKNLKLTTPVDVMFGNSLLEGGAFE